MELQSVLTLTAIIVALIIGVSALVQTNIIQKGERKQRLLNEIIDWANDILNYGSEMVVQPTPGITQIARLLQATSALYLRYRAVNARTEYVEKIASKFGQALLPTLIPTISILKDLIKLLEQNITTLMQGHKIDDETHEKTNSCELELYNLTRSLMENIAKVKLK